MCVTMKNTPCKRGSTVYTMLGQCFQDKLAGGGQDARAWRSHWPGAIWRAYLTKTSVIRRLQLWATHLTAETTQSTCRCRQVLLHLQELPSWCSDWGPWYRTSCSECSSERWSATAGRNCPQRARTRKHLTANQVTNDLLTYRRVPSQILRRRTSERRKAWLMNGELEKIWEKAVVV
jgi:hypothetical protein